MHTIKSQLAGYKSKVINISNDIYSIQSTKVILSRDIDTLSLNIDEKKIQLND